MAKFRQGDLVLTQTQKIIQGSDTILSSDGTANLNALAISNDPIITSITTDGDLTSNSDNKLATEKAIRTYVANHGGTGGTGGSATAGYYIHTQSTPASTWNVEHNLDEQFVNVEVVGTDNKSVVPSEINFTDSTSLQIEFSYNVAGYASIVIGGAAGTSGTSGTSGGGYVYTQSVDSTSWVIVHNLGQQYVNVETIDSNDISIDPEEIIFTDSTSLIINFATSESGHASISIGYPGAAGSSGTSGTSGVGGTSGTSGTSSSGNRYLHNQTSDSTSWNVVHNLGEKYVVVQVYDENDYFILPQDIHLDSTSEVTITFVENQKGSAIVLT